MSYTPDTLPVTVLVNDVDVTDYAVIPDLDDYYGMAGAQITSALNSRIDTLRLAFIDAGALGLEAWQIIVIEEADETRHFGGFIAIVTEREEGVALLHLVDAVDFSVLLDRAFLTAEYEDKNDAELIAAAFADCDPPLDDIIDLTLIANVGSARDIRRYNRVRMRDFLDDLAGEFGADWYVDYGEDAAEGTLARLHWFVGQDATAPFVLSDAPNGSTSYGYGNLERENDGSDVVNLIEVIGGAYLSADVTHEYAGDGQQVRFILPFRYKPQEEEARVLIDRNDGDDADPVWTALEVGTWPRDEEDLGDGKDALYGFTDSVVVFATAPPDLTRAFRIGGRYEIPIRALVRDSASFEEYGYWLKEIINDNTLISKQAAQQRAKAALAERSLVTPAWTLTTWQPGLRSGQRVRLINALRSIDTQYLIQQVVTTWPGAGGQAQFEATLGVWNPDLIDQILKLKRLATPQPEYRDDEVLDIVLDRQRTIVIEEGTPSVSTSTGPYLWGTAIWGLFKWDTS